MRTKIVLILATALIIALTAGVAPAATTMSDPVVTLDRMEVQNYWGFWIDGKASPAEKRGAPIVLAFVFNVANPNSIPVMLDELKFTISFEDYDVNTLAYTNPMWIPAGKTNQVRVCAGMSAYTTMLNLAVTSGFKMKEQGVNAGDLLKRWWTTITDSAFPVNIHSGVAAFEWEGGDARVTFVGKFGGK